MQAEFTRRPSALAVRFRRLLLSLATIPSIACGNGGPGSVGSSTVFPDPKIAELADAAVSGDRTRVLELVRSGADPSTRGAKGVNLLQWALLNRSGAGLEALLEAGADPAAPDSSGETVVHYAAKANEPSYLDILLAGGASPDTPHGVTGATPLVSALLAEREEQFKKLLAAGANPNSPDRMGNTPLHAAGKFNEPQRAIDLLQAGADPAATNRQGAPSSGISP